MHIRLHHKAANKHFSLTIFADKVVVRREGCGTFPQDTPHIRHKMQCMSVVHSAEWFTYEDATLLKLGRYWIDRLPHMVEG